jgi:AcrR family transcriptional regulator
VYRKQGKSVARPINKQLRQARSDDILAAARAQLASEGLSNFSLRAVARRMELTPNALYSYFPCLDDLITALLVDAFKHFADALADAADPVEGVAAKRFERVCLAYRQWVITHPVDYDLIFGSPLPGYHAPEDITGPLSVRGFEIGLRVLVDAWQSGQLKIPARYRQLPGGIAQTLATQVSEIDADAPLVLRYLMLVVWSRLHGLVTLEIHGNARHAVGDLEAFFVHNIECLIAEIGLIHASS